MSAPIASVCLLNAGRVLGLLGRYAEAEKLIREAYAIEPAINISKATGPVAQTSIGTLSAKQSSDKTEFLTNLSQLPQANDLLFSQSRQVPDNFVAALLNEGFELGSLQYWTDQTGAAWRNSGGYNSSAAVTVEHAHTGLYSLKIQGAKCDGPDQRGTTGQSFPVSPAGVCRFSCWAKGRDLQVGALAVIESEGQKILELPAGSFEWTKFEGVVSLPRQDKVSPVTPFRIAFVSSGSGQVWLDDLRVVVQSGESIAND